MGQPSPQPFRMHVADETLRDLRERLMHVRWPDEPPGAAWSTGSSVDYVRSLSATGATASTGARRKPPSIVSTSSRFPWAGSTCTSFMKRVRARTRCRCYYRTAGRVRSSSSIRSCPCSRTPRVLAGIPRIPSPSWRRRWQGTLVLCSGAKTVRRRGDQRAFGRADDRRARLWSVRGGGRGLGRIHNLALGLPVSRAHHWHPLEYARRAT